MIECVDENIIYKKKRKRKKKNRKRFFVWFFIILLIFLLGVHYKVNVSNNVIKILEDKTYSISTETVNEVVFESLKNDINYSDLIIIEKDQSGNIVFMSTNSHKINYINRLVSISSHAKLENKLKDGIKLPWLAFLGIGIFSGYGSEIYFKNISISSVECDFLSSFYSMGINQTLHSLYLEVNAKTKIDMPLNNKTIDLKSKILLTEAVLVGKVPDIYLNGNALSVR